MDNSIDWLQRDEDVPNNAIACQTNGFLSTGSSVRPESTPMILAKEECDKKVCEHLAAAVTEEISLPLQLNDSCSNTDTPELMLLPSVNVNLSSFMPDEESISTLSEYKVKRSPRGSAESSAEGNLDEHSGREAAETLSQVIAALEDSKVGESKEEVAKRTSETALVNIELNTQFIDSELPVPAGSLISSCVSEDKLPSRFKISGFSAIGLRSIFSDCTDLQDTSLCLRKLR